MKIKGIDHIGVAVKDLEATIQFYEQVLGLEVTEKMDHGQGRNRGAFVRVGQVDFELIENKDPQSAIGRHIEKRGEGIQHIAFEVDRLEEAMADMKEKGIPFIDETPRPGARDSRIVFMHPKQTYGVLMELVERK
jgi:methylmalonyl-CoA/ethylmalonyl-CoA epimerase